MADHYKMLQFIIFSFFPPFFITFLLPGVILALIAIHKNKLNLIPFLLFTTFFGFASQVIISLGVILLNYFYPNNLQLYTIIIAEFFIILSIIFLRIRSRKLIDNNFTNLQISASDGAMILVAIILIITVAYQVSSLEVPYFNQATDQYFWFGYTKSLLHNPLETNRSIFQPWRISNKEGFALLIASYIPFIADNFNDYQKFILIISCFFYILQALAIFQLGRIILPVPQLAILTPLIVFSFYWSNYYQLSAAVVPQNVGIFLYIFGFLLIHYHRTWFKENLIIWPIIISFIALFYYIHFASLVIFLIAIGVASIIEIIILYIKKYWADTSLLYEKFFLNIKKILNSITAIAFPLAIIAIIRYLLYFFKLLPNRDIRSIAYLNDYLRPLGLWDQPYVNSYGISVIWFSILGFLIALITVIISKRISAALLSLIISFTLIFIYLKTPWVTYHAIYASWQQFRYFIFLYPAIAVFCLLPLSVLIKQVKEKLSIRMGQIVIFLTIIFLVPNLFIKVLEQQSYVFTEMINKTAEVDIIKKEKIKELLLASKKNDRDILFLGNIDAVYLGWIFEPRKVFLPEECYNYRYCLIANATDGQRKYLEETDVHLLIIEKNKDKTKAEINILKKFKKWQDAEHFSFYTD